MSEIEVTIDECARESEQELGTDREAATTRCAEQDAIFDSCIVGQQQRRSSTVSVAEEQAQVRGTPTGPKRSGKKRSTGKSSSRRSGSDDRTATGGGSTKSTSYVRQEEYDAELDRLQRLSNAALEGDSAALDQLRTALDDVAHVWHRLADLQLHVELALVEKIASADPLRREAFL